LLRHDIKQLNGARFAHQAQDPFEKSGVKLNPKGPPAKAWANNNRFRLFHGGIMSGDSGNATKQNFSGCPVNEGERDGH
jgi:hypothetical protein